MEKGVVTFVRRDTGEKSETARNDIVQGARAMLSRIADDMLARATKLMEENIVTAHSLDGLASVPKMIKIGWCGEEACGREIETKADKNILGTPIDGETWDGKCVVCGKPTKHPVYIANAM